MYREELQIKLSHLYGGPACLASPLPGFEMWSFVTSDVFPGMFEVKATPLSTVLNTNDLKEFNVFLPNRAHVNNQIKEILIS